MRDMEQNQRNDINNLQKNTIGLQIDEYTHLTSPYIIELTNNNYNITNWIINTDNSIEKTNLTNENLIFNIPSLHELQFKNIVNIKIGFDVTIENYNPYPPKIVAVGLNEIMTPLDEQLINNIHIELPINIDSFEQVDLNKLICEDGFNINLNINTTYSNTHIILSNLKLLLFFQDKLKQEKDAVFNRIQEEIVNVIYPVGSIYMSVNTSNPSALFPNTTWQKIENRFLLGSGSSYTIGATGGSKDAVVVNHNHTQNAHTHIQNAHNHSLNRPFSDGSGSESAYVQTANRTTSTKYTTSTTATNQSTTATNNATGVDGTNKNMPPYLVVNIWKRTA